MPWLSPSQDPTLAELAARATISGGGGISPALLRPPPNQWEELFKTVAPLVRDYIQKKKSDAIANQLQNMYAPPRAEAVDQYGATYDPALAARQGLIGPEPRATMPFTGGADQFKVAEMYRKQMESEEDRDLNRRAKWAQINARGESRVPVEIEGQTYHVTPNEALRHFDRVRTSTGKTDPATKFNKDVESDYGLTAEDISGIGATDIDFYDASGNVLTQEKVNEKPEDAWVMGKAGDKTVRVPYQDWVKLGTRWKNLPNRTSNPAVQSYQEIQKQSSQGKQLDQATAKAILDEAGGDKEKARQIARERGFFF